MDNVHRPEFSFGGTVRVKAKEGSRERLQDYEGLVMAVLTQRLRFVKYLLVKVLNAYFNFTHRSLIA